MINWECELSTLSHEEPWIALDAALTRKEFAGLRRVVFKISFVRNTPFMIVGAAKGAIEASCTRLASAGIMSVEVSNGECSFIFFWGEEGGGVHFCLLKT